MRDCNSILDIGCGDNSPLQLFQRRKHTTGIDIHASTLQKTKKRKIHDEYVKGDILLLDKLFLNKSFDAVTAFDVIEHLKKEDGIKLIRDMEAIARKKVVIFTPNGFLEQEVYDDNPYQKHLSGWTMDEMRKRGYRVWGANGLKWLRTIRGELKYKPKIMWIVIADLSQIITKIFPRIAFQLICIKKIR